MTFLEEAFDDFRSRLFTGRAERREGETHEQFALRLLGEQAAEAEKAVEGLRASRKAAEEADKALWRHVFVEKTPTGKSKDGDQVRKQYKVWPHELEAFSKQFNVSAKELERLSAGEIKGPVGGLLRAWDVQPAHHQIGHSYQPPKDYDPPSKPEKPYQLGEHERRVAQVNVVNWRPVAKKLD